MRKTTYHIVILICTSLLIIAIVPDIISLFNKDFSYGKTYVGKIDLLLNKYIYFDIIKWVGFIILNITLGMYLARFYKWSRTPLIIFYIVSLVVWYVILYPFLTILNIFFMLICRNPPIYNMEDKQRMFPYLSVIEKNQKKIKREFENFESSIKCTFMQTIGFRIGTSEDQGKCWRLLRLKQSGQLQEVADKFPETTALIKHPSIHNAFFSILDANVNIEPHIGYYKGYLRYHLGVIIPEEDGKRPYIEVGKMRYYWKEGEGVLFDDMFYHHVKNPTNKMRVVLYIDLIRPFYEPINTINRFMIRLIEDNLILKYVIKRQHKQISSKDVMIHKSEVS